MKSQNRCILFLIRCAMAVLLGLGLALLLNVQAVAEVQLEVLKTKTDTFKNVTVTGRNETDIFITHSKGLGNVKIKDLDADTLARLGMGPEPVGAASATAKPAVGSAADPATGTAEGNAALAALPPELQAKMEAARAFQEGMPEIAISAINPVVLGSVIAVVLFLHLFFSYCLKLIIEKAGSQPGLMVWLPFFQWLPAFRAATMSGWWLVAPFTAIIASAALVSSFEQFASGAPWVAAGGILASVAWLIFSVGLLIWCFKIVEARGKSVWVAIALLLPGVSLIAFLYLAFSSGVGSDDVSQLSDEEAPPVLLEA